MIVDASSLVEPVQVRDWCKPARIVVTTRPGALATIDNSTGLGLHCKFSLPAPPRRCPAVEGFSTENYGGARFEFLADEGTYYLRAGGRVSVFGGRGTWTVEAFEQEGEGREEDVEVWLTRVYRVAGPLILAPNHTRVRVVFGTLVLASGPALNVFAPPVSAAVAAGANVVAGSVLQTGLLI